LRGLKEALRETVLPDGNGVNRPPKQRVLGRNNALCASFTAVSPAILPCLPDCAAPAPAASRQRRVSPAPPRLFVRILRQCSRRVPFGEKHPAPSRAAGTGPLGTCSESPGTCSESPGTCSESPGTCSESPGTCSESSGTCSESFGTCSEPSGTCSEPSGTCSEPPGTCSESSRTPFRAVPNAAPNVKNPSFGPAPPAVCRA
jgi:hypothetical protein